MELPRGKVVLLHGMSLREAVTPLELLGKIDRFFAFLSNDPLLRITRRSGGDSSLLLLPRLTVASVVPNLPTYLSGHRL